MKTKIMMLLIVYFFALSCNKKDTTEANNETLNDSTEVVLNDDHYAKNSLDYIGMYKGIVPCADCEGIETNLHLVDEKNYVLKTKYLGKKDTATNELRGAYSWNKEGNTITLSGNENGASHYFVGENYLTQLDMDGNKIEGDLADKYVLQKVSDSAESTPASPTDEVRDNQLVFKKWRLVEWNEGC